MGGGSGLPSSCTFLLNQSFVCLISIVDCKKLIVVKVDIISSEHISSIIFKLAQSNAQDLSVTIIS